MARSRWAQLTGWTLLTWAAAGHASSAQTVLMPGELRERIPAAGLVIQADSGNNFGDLRSQADVTFGRIDEQSQVMKVLASHRVSEFPVYGTAVARGMLYVDFCVPTPGLTECISDPSASDVNASITFAYGLIGRVAALGLTAKATFQATASVLDLHDNRLVNFLELANLSAALGTKAEIAEVPVPMPAFSGAGISLPVTFTTTLKRGRTYRFRLAAAATSTKGVLQPPTGSPTFALADFARPLPPYQEDGFVMLRNLTIAVSPDPTDSLASLRAVIGSLQDQIIRMVEQIEGLRADHEDDVSRLREELAALRLSTIGPDPGICLAQPPAQDWICVTGFWVPPDLLSVGGSPPPAACSTVMPAPGWVCVNGGWVPPTHPLASAPAAPAACTTAAPGPGWICVNGGWVPPGHPLAGGR